MQFSILQTFVFSYFQPHQPDFFLQPTSALFNSALFSPAGNAENSPPSIPGYHPRG